MRKALALVFVTGALCTAGIGSASAGEVTGSGGTTGMRAHANSECGFSGLEDGGEGGPSGPGVTPQSFGHAQQDSGLTLKQIKEFGFNPGAACNGHLAGRK